MTTQLIQTEESRPVAERECAGQSAIAVSEFAGRILASREWIILVALAVAMIAQLWTSVVQLSITSDEIDHLHAAYRYWQCNDFGWNPEHPPVVKIVAGLPLQFMTVNDPFPHACGAQNTKVVDFLTGHQFIVSNPERMLTAARFTVCVFPLLLLVAVWFLARKMFGLPVAVISGVLVVFEPNILANGPLITTDVAATLGFLVAIYAAYSYANAPNFSRVLALGLAVGFAFTAKYSMVVLAVILPAVLLADCIVFSKGRRWPTLLRYAGVLTAVAFISLTVLWACYGFHYVARPGGAPTWDPPRLTMARGAVITKFVPLLKSKRALPEGYLVGLQDVLVESEVGRSSFLLGKLYRSSNWFYFPVEASIKFTLPILLMVAVSAAAFRFWRCRPREALFLLLPAVLFLIVCMRSGLNIGIRHLLPLLPLLIIFAAAGLWHLGSNRRWVLAAVLILLTWHAVSSLHAFPNYLSYSNEAWGGPSETYRYLSHSDVDWGQAQKMVRDYVDRTHPANCFYIRSYNNLNSDYGIRCRGISEIQWDQLETPFTGTLIAGVSVVNGVGFRGVSAELHRALKDIKPTAKLGGSAVLVYEGTFDLGTIVAVQLLFRARQIGEENEQLALALAQRASVLDPLSGDAHAVMCGSYAALGQMAKAEQECNAGLALIRKDPQYGPQQVTYMEDFISKKGLRIYSPNGAHD